MKDLTKLNSQDLQDSLLNHVVLPRCLPQQISKNHYALEQQLSIQFVENVENLSEWIPAKTVELFKRFSRVHNECTASIIADEISDLKPGDTFAIYEWRQNCAFILYIPSDENENLKTDETDDDISEATANDVIVATFPGSLYPNEIYAFDSDIAVI